MLFIPRKSVMTLFVRQPKRQRSNTSPLQVGVQFFRHPHSRPQVSSVIHQTLLSLHQAFFFPHEQIHACDVFAKVTRQRKKTMSRKRYFMVLPFCQSAVLLTLSTFSCIEEFLFQTQCPYNLSGNSSTLFYTKRTLAMQWAVPILRNPSVDV